MFDYDLNLVKLWMLLPENSNSLQAKISIFIYTYPVWLCASCLDAVVVSEKDSDKEREEYQRAHRNTVYEHPGDPKPALYTFV